MSTSQKLCVKYNDYISEFVSKNLDSKKLKHFTVPSKIIFGPLKIVLCEVSLYNVKDEEAFLPFFEFLLIQNSDLLEVLYEEPLIENVRILTIINSERIESALWALFSFFGDAFKISGCILQLDVEGPALSFNFLVNEFINAQKVFSEVTVELEPTNNEKISCIALFGKSLGRNSNWKISSPDKNVIRYTLWLRNEGLQEINEIYQRNSAYIPFKVLFFKMHTYLYAIYLRKAFSVVIYPLTYPLFEYLNHIKLDLNDLVIFEPSLLGSCKKKHFRFLWAFYSLCCRQYWSFDLPAEVLCSSNSDYFDEKNPFIVSFYITDFLHQARLTNHSKNRKFAVEFFQDLNSCVETEISEEKKYFPFSSLVVDFKTKRDTRRILVEIKLDSAKFFEFFNPLSLYSINYRDEIWIKFLEYALQQGFTVKQMDVYMQQFFLFYSHLSVKERYYGFFEAVPFLELKNLIEPVVKNSKESKENKNKNKIYLTIICFLLFSP